MFTQHRQQAPTVCKSLKVKGKVLQLSPAINSQEQHGAQPAYSVCTSFLASPL